MKEWHGRKREPVTEQRLERAVEVLAQIVKEHGPSYGPLYESLEQELADFRRLRQAAGAPSKQSGYKPGTAGEAVKVKKRMSA
jgi:hypothetical protein